MEAPIAALAVPSAPGTPAVDAPQDPPQVIADDAVTAPRSADVALRERLAMADELHDLLAHELSLVTVQLAAARQIGGRDAEAASQALDIATTACRACLSSIRRCAGLGSIEAHVRYGPQPGIADLDVLHRLARVAGGSLTLPDDPEILADVPRDVALCSFRAIEILLDDAAGRSPTLEVGIDGHAVTLVLVVADGGPPPLSHGVGLRRLVERVDVFGGTLAREVHGEAWRICVRLPTTR